MDNKSWLAGPWLPRMFVGLYLLIGVATLRHSAYGFASIESDNMAWGLLSALAVDVLMILFAHGLRDGFRRDYALGLAIPAALSVYTQLLFAVSESQAMTVAPGAIWLGGATSILRWRIVLLPAALPVLALVASLAGRGSQTHVTIEQYDRVVASKSKLERELDNHEPALEELRRAAQSQQGVVTELQVENAGLVREIEAAGVFNNLPGKVRANIATQFWNGDKLRTNKELAAIVGASESQVSRALTERRKEKSAEMREEAR